MRNHFFLWVWVVFGGIMAIAYTETAGIEKAMEVIGAAMLAGIVIAFVGFICQAIRNMPTPEQP